MAQLCLPAFRPLGPSLQATARPSKAPGSTHRLQWPRGPAATPATSAGPPRSHRFFPAGPGFLPSRECAPGMSILIARRSGRIKLRFVGQHPKVSEIQGRLSNQAAGQRSGLTLSLPLTPPVCLPAAAFPQLPPASALPWPAQRAPPPPPPHSSPVSPPSVSPL